ncbi:hypothetical protein [Flagellimonas onchidii]|uniref:hypothetical protein n=1 Tax=Flagellimonas onchidii TaxID=2562684 RepID=UPI0010A5DA54|nr:hypothetical protein [Allomuricauda onchidii]
MRKIVCLAFLLTNLGFGQTGFIEIEVKDSIHLKPINFEYEIKISQDRFVNYTESAHGITDSTKTKMREKLAELKSFLESKNYKIRPLNNEKYQIHDYVGFWNLGYAVDLSESKELETLTSELKKFDFITGNVGQITFDENDSWEERLFEKLIAKAKLKAKMVCQLTDQKLGKIIELKEGKTNNDFELNIKDIYLMVATGGDWTVEKNMIFGNRWKIVSFKFETK